MKTYTTVQGDMWDAVAFKTLGDTAYTGTLMDLNQKHLGFFVFPAGITLRLPDPIETTSERMPPWKRVAG